VDTQEKMKRLRDFNFWRVKNSKSMAEWLEMFISYEEAGRHGESFELGEILSKVHSEYLSNPERLIKIFPFILMAEVQAVVETVVESNCLMLDVVADLIDSKRAK